LDGVLREFLSLESSGNLQIELWKCCNTCANLVYEQLESLRSSKYYGVLKKAAKLGINMKIYLLGLFGAILRKEGRRKA